MISRAVFIPVLAGLAACAAAGCGAAAASEGGLQRLLDADLARYPAKAGIYVKHLTTGEEAVVRADDVFNSASVIKIPIMIVAYRLAEQGNLALDARVTTRKADFRSGSGVLRYHDPGVQPTVRDLVTQMIITSDNTATDLVLDRVGGVARVNAWLADNEHQGVRLNSTIFEVFKRRYVFADPRLETMTPEELYAVQTADPGFAGLPQDRYTAIQRAMQRPGVGAELARQVNEDPSTWFGQITPRTAGRLLESIQSCAGWMKASCTEMMRTLGRQQSGARRLPHYVDVPVAHKTGDFPPHIANDVGVIHARSGPVVVAVLTNAIREPYAELEDRIGRTARTIVDYFDGPSRD